MQRTYSDSEYGGIEIHAGAPFSYGNLSCPTTIYTWRPPRQLEWLRQTGFALAFECYNPTGDKRIFMPAKNGLAYVYGAFQAGLELLRHQKGLTPEHYASYLVMRLLFTRVRRTHSYANRQFNAARDLYVRPSGRQSSNKYSLLPEDVGLDSQDNGRPWSIANLINTGRKEAQQQGVKNPTNRHAISFGLAAAARLRPLQLCDGDAATLMRMALFDTSKVAQRPGADLVMVVMERLAQAVNENLDTNSNEQFDKWFLPGKGNLTKSIMGGKRQLGGRLSKDDVNRVLVDQSWAAYQYLADCLKAFAHWFVRSLPEPLNEQEVLRFEQMYAPQTYYGGLALPLLLDRAPLLQYPICELWDNPAQPEAIGVLHRLLSWYAELNVKRRAADRRFKQKSGNAKTAPRELTGMEQQLNLYTRSKPG